MIIIFLFREIFDSINGQLSSKNRPRFSLYTDCHNYHWLIIIVGFIVPRDQDPKKEDTFLLHTDVPSPARLVICFQCQEEFSGLFPSWGSGPRSNFVIKILWPSIFTQSLEVKRINLDQGIVSGTLNHELISKVTLTFTYFYK